VFESEELYFLICLLRSLSSHAPFKARLSTNNVAASNRYPRERRQKPEQQAYRPCNCWQISWCCWPKCALG